MKKVGKEVRWSIQRNVRIVMPMYELSKNRCRESARLDVPVVMIPTLDRHTHTNTPYRSFPLSSFLDNRLSHNAI